MRNYAKKNRRYVEMLEQATLKISLLIKLDAKRLHIELES